MDPHPQLSRIGLLGVVPLLLAAGPPAPEASLAAGLSLGRSALLADPEPSDGDLLQEDYRVFHAGADLRVDQRWEKGWVLSVAGVVAPGVPTVLRDSAMEPQLERAYLWSGMTKVEAGFHGEHLGIQAGPALLWRADTPDGFLVPSGSLWAGKPEILYAWAEGPPFPLGGWDGLQWAGGLGHRSSELHLELGTSGLGWWVGRAGVQVVQGLWISGEVAGRAVDELGTPPLRGRLGITLQPGALRQGAAEPSPPSTSAAVP